MDTKLLHGKYKRRSSDDSEDKQVASIESQERELNEVKQKLSLKTKDYDPESRSAHTIGRPVFNHLLDDIEKGVINALLVYHANRLARNAYDAGRLIYLMDEGKLLEIRTPSRVYKNTPEDKFMLNLEFGISKKDSDDKGIVVKRGLKNKLIQGWRPGIAPQGYLNDKSSDIGTRKIMVDPKRFPFIQKIFELKLNGTPVKKIHQIAENEWKYRTKTTKRMGGKPLSRSMVYSILTNPFYYGEFEYPEGTNQWWKGSHQPAVTKEVFEKIQLMLGNKGLKAKPHTKEFAYTGLIRCGECQGVITAEEKHQVICSECKYKFALTQKNQDKCPNCKTALDNMTSPKFLNYTYYRCFKRKDPNCAQRSIELTQLENQLKEKVGSIEISDNFMDWAIRQINKDNDNDQSFEHNKWESLKKAREDCMQRIDNLLTTKISSLNTDGSMMSDEKYKVENTKLEDELKNLNKQISEFDEISSQRRQKVVDEFDFAAHAKERFDTGDIHVKRKILSDLGTGFVLNDRTLIIDLPNTYIRIKELVDQVPQVRRSFEPSENGYTKAQLEAFYASNPTVLRD